MPEGCRNYFILSIEDVGEICELFLRGSWSYADLGERFKVSRHTISSLLTGRSWKGVIPTEQLAAIAKVREGRRDFNWR